MSDLDGTLLRSDATLADFARDGLNRIIASGTPVTVASARSLQAMRALLAGVRLELPVIGLNGALISDPHTGRHLHIRALESSTARASVSMLAACGASPVLTSWDGIHDRVHFSGGMNPASDWWVAEKLDYGDPRLRPSADLDAVAAQEEVVMVTGFVPDSDAPRIVGRLRERLAGAAIVHAAPQIYYVGWTEIQIQHSQADKGDGLPRLLELTGLCGSTVLVCGDDVNDLGLFAVADESIAPANAHPSVRAAASITVASNDEDGVIRWLMSRVGLDGASAPA